MGPDYEIQKRVMKILRIRITESCRALSRGGQRATEACRAANDSPAGHGYVNNRRVKEAKGKDVVDGQASKPCCFWEVAEHEPGGVSRADPGRAAGDVRGSLSAQFGVYQGPLGPGVERGCGQTRTDEEQGRGSGSKQWISLVQGTGRKDVGKGPVTRCLMPGVPTVDYSFTHTITKQGDQGLKTL
jgi:hypothetical protein